MLNPVSFETGFCFFLWGFSVPVAYYTKRCYYLNIWGLDKGLGLYERL